VDIQFFGAVQSVTGSMHVVSVNGKKILLECGLFQGSRQKAFEKNQHLPFDPASIHCMVLSHAHIDHSGNIPQLVKQGFEGNIFCTHATQDLVGVMLRDSAYIQEKDADFVNKRHRKKGLPPVKPLYTIEDTEKCLSQFIGIGYDRPFPISENVRLTFLDAGHIIGSAIVVLDIQENGRSLRLAFTGDLGRKNLPIIKNPVLLNETDIFISESTYGNRIHEPIQNMKGTLRKVVQTTVERGGKIIVPAFSLGRTQELIYFLHELFSEGSLPEIPIFVDSPLSVNVTEIFRLHPECFDRETRSKFISNHEDPFGFQRLRYIRNVEESKKLNTLNEPCIIISASGMCEAGRILHHLIHTIPDSKNTILIVGYMAENTLGKRLVERRPVVKIFGEEVALNAQVVIMNGFSSHADKNELLEYFNHLKKERLQHVFVVHGEPEPAEAFCNAIKETGFQHVTAPSEGDRVEI